MPTFDRARIRANGISVILWIFGLATTVTLISTWGRAVATDVDVLDSAARELATSGLVTEMLIAEVGEIASTDASGTGTALAVLADDPRVELALKNVMSDVVRAATAADGRYHRVDVAERLLPIAPVVAGEAAQRGIPLDTPTIAAALSTIEPIDVRADGEPPVVGPSSAAAGAFTLATATALGILLVTGGASVYLSDDRRFMIRSLANRILVSALSFSVMLRLGSWIADPRGGRAPMRSAVSLLVGAKIWIPLTVAGLAGGVAGVLWLTRRRSGRGDTASIEADDPSEELPVLVAG